MSGTDRAGFDVVCIGRALVDFYAEQIDGPLEEMVSAVAFAGGSGTNIAIGAAKLGLKVAMMTRVGNDHLGRFIRATFEAAGVDVRHVITDPDRPTPHTVLGVLNPGTFVLDLFARDRPELALRPEEVDEAAISSAKVLVVNGALFAAPDSEAMLRKALAVAREAGVRTALDVDYRPVLWGLMGHGQANRMFVASESVTERLLPTVPLFDLIVGTEEEIHITGGTTDTVAALREIRARGTATIVLKRGARGCVAFDGAIPERPEDGLVVPSARVEIYNNMGAGDAFMAGFLKGWVEDALLEICCRYGNACGAIVVSRHGCSDASPSWAEVEDFLGRPGGVFRVSRDSRLTHLHRQGNRGQGRADVCGVALDRLPAGGDGESRLRRIAEGVLEAAKAEGIKGAGLTLGASCGRRLLADLTASDLWLARGLAMAGDASPFVRGVETTIQLRGWPRRHVVYLELSAVERPSLAEEQLELAEGVYRACGATTNELMVGITLPEEGGEQPAAQILADFYKNGVCPDRWCLPALGSRPAWDEIAGCVRRYDPDCRGVLVRLPSSSLERAEEIFAMLAETGVGGGFILEPGGSVDGIVADYRRLAALWRAARGCTGSA